MTTPQNPGDGDTPQDPSDPQNPYGTPPPPPRPRPRRRATRAPPPTPPPAPSDPRSPDARRSRGAAAVRRPAGGARRRPPAAPPYGAAGVRPASRPTAQPGLPAVHRAGPAEPGKGMAITALIAVDPRLHLHRRARRDPAGDRGAGPGQDGRNHGKGLAIAALVISVLSLIGLAIGGYFVVRLRQGLQDVDDLKAGQCITANGLTDESATGVTEIRSVGCSTKHDGEVLVHGEADRRRGGQLRRRPRPVAICTPSVTDAGKRRPARQPGPGPHRPHPGLVARRPATSWSA